MSDPISVQRKQAICNGQGVVAFRGYVEGPRWAKFPKFLRNECWRRELALELEVEKGWIRETVRFHVLGPPAQVKAFEAMLHTSLAEWNKDD